MHTSEVKTDQLAGVFTIKSNFKEDTSKASFVGAVDYDDDEKLLEI